MDAAETMQYLRGTWRARRDVSDHRSGEHSVFVGTATFTPSRRARGTVLRFEEFGEMRLGDYHGPSSRLLDYVEADGRATIEFTDGRHFIDLDLADGESRDIHLCGLDRYEITTVARSADLIEERWRVVGPEKDYEAVTTLERVTDDPST
jgi:hypothetical protein